MRHREFLNWLSMEDFQVRHWDLFSQCQKRTGNWFLESAKFVAWLEGTTRTLLCSGIPGGGKTFMSAIVLNHLRESCANAGIAVLYCSYSMREQQTKSNLLAALHRQLVTYEHTVSEHAQHLLGQCERADIQPTFGRLSSLLQHVVGSYAQVYIVINALNKCASAEWQPVMAELQCLQALHPTVRLMVTFRPQVVFESDFVDSDELEIRASSWDLQQFIEGRMSLLSKQVMKTPSLRDDVLRSIIHAADGM
jgi:Cdc6-like AAA superfamily ATPase